MILETYHQSHYITSLNSKDGAKKLFWCELEILIKS